MKTLITLNVGLNTVNNTRVDVHSALGAVAACGVSVTSSAVVQGEWEGKPEPCLFVQGFVADPLGVAFRAQLFLASRLLSQHAIAIYFDGRGELIGDNPEKWEFDAELFHFHPEGQTASREFTVDGWTKETFVRYLEETLIPDLKESGFEATASDFETALQFIRR